MVDPAPRTPEQLAQDAKKSADDAAESARNAVTSETNAGQAAARAEKEVEKPKRIAWLTFFVSFLTFVAVGAQSILTKCSVDLTNNQMRTGFLQQQKSDEERLTERLTESIAFHELHALDPSCARNAVLTPSKIIDVSLLIQRFIEHYEHYYRMTATLDLGPDWEEICKRAQRTLDTYCHLRERLTPLLDRGTQEFKEAFEKCKLPAVSQP